MIVIVVNDLSKMRETQLPLSHLRQNFFYTYIFHPCCILFYSVVTSIPSWQKEASLPLNERIEMNLATTPETTRQVRLDFEWSIAGGEIKKSGE